MNCRRRLIVQTLVFSRTYLHRRVSLPETLVVKGGTIWARNGRWILPENARLPRNIQGSFTCCKSTTWDKRLYFPSEGRRAEDFFALKNPTAMAGFEPANLGTKGQHATSRPPKPRYNKLGMLDERYARLRTEAGFHVIPRIDITERIALAKLLPAAIHVTLFLGLQMSFPSPFFFYFLATCQAYTILIGFTVLTPGFVDTPVLIAKLPNYTWCAKNSWRSLKFEDQPARYAALPYWSPSCIVKSGVWVGQCTTALRHWNYQNRSSLLQLRSAVSDDSVEDLM